MKNVKEQILCSWGGVAFMVVLLIGWGILSGMIPPHSPTNTPEEIVAFYQGNPLAIRLGLVVCLLGVVLYLPFAGVISAQMARIEGPYSIWSRVQSMASIGTVMTFVVPLLLWQTASFRPERDIQLTLLLNDLAWVFFMAATAPFYIQPIAIAIAGFKDKSANPIFSRTVCYYNLMASLMVMPGCIIVMFKTGPFAWDGLFGFWIPLVDFGIWFIVMAVVLSKAVKRQAMEGLANPVAA